MSLRQRGHCINSLVSRPIMLSLNFSSQCGHRASKSNMVFLSLGFQEKGANFRLRLPPQKYCVAGPQSRCSGITFQSNSGGVYSLSFSFTSSSTKGMNTDCMLSGLTNIDWKPSFVHKMMVRRSTLLTVKIIPLSMFLNMSPAFITVFPFLRIVRLLNS